MKDLYDKKGLQTKESHEFGIKIEEVIRPIFKEYLEKGFSVRDLSHEAQAMVRDCELDYMMDIHMENAKKAKVNLERKKLNAEIEKKYGLTEKDWDYGTDGKQI